MSRNGGNIMSSRNNVLPSLFVVLLMMSPATPTNIFIAAVCYSGCGSLAVVCYVGNGIANGIQYAKTSSPLPPTEEGCGESFDACKTHCLRTFTLTP
ncbi:hypothetical protein ACI65C_003286 [Semiaphis heraclei]